MFKIMENINEILISLFNKKDTTEHYCVTYNYNEKDCVLYIYLFLLDNASFRLGLQCCATLNHHKIIGLFLLAEPIELLQKLFLSE